MKSRLPILFYLLGISLLAFLIYKMDINVVVETMSTVGYGIFLVFLTAIPWIIAHTMSISNLTKNKISFLRLLYIQVTGDAYNDIIPLAGLGGEPYKIKMLSRDIDIQDASRAIIQERLIHSMTGILFTAITGGLLLWLVPMSEAYQVPILICTIVFSILPILMIWLILSKAPTKLSGFILKKLKFIKNFKNEALTTRRFMISFGWKMLARALNFGEIYMIFIVLGFAPSFADMVAVSAMISLSATLLFIVPQGIGVNEMGISTAFTMVGYAASVGLIFGLIRRSRIVFWALFGVALNLTYVFFEKAMRARQYRELIQSRKQMSK